MIKILGAIAGLLLIVVVGYVSILFALRGSTTAYRILTNLVPSPQTYTIFSQRP